MTDEAERFQARTWQQTGDPRDGAAYYDTVARRCPLMCPSCGRGESLGDLLRNRCVPPNSPSENNVHGALVVGRTPGDVVGGAHSTAVGSLGVLDTCARCGTVWNRHAPARAAGILRGAHNVEPTTESEVVLDLAERTQALNTARDQAHALAMAQVNAIRAATERADAQRVREPCGVFFFWPRGAGPGPLPESLPGQSPADTEVYRAWRTRRQVTCTFPAGHDGRHGAQADDVGLIRSDFSGPREDARCTCSGSWRVGVYMLGGRSTCLACELPVESANTKGRGP